VFTRQRHKKTTTTSHCSDSPEKDAEDETIQKIKKEAEMTEADK
jgi:hypothetical protein